MLSCVGKRHITFLSRYTLQGCKLFGFVEFALLLILTAQLTSSSAFTSSLLADKRVRHNKAILLKAKKSEAHDPAASRPSASDLIQNLRDKFEYEGRLEQADDNHRCGFITLIGAANMGKSTLLNALLQETLCTTTHRPQTTRHSILGVLSSEEESCQLCFTDTPGVIGDPAYKLQEGMMEAVKGAFSSSDVILVVTDLFSTPIPDDVLFQRITASKKKKIVVINKIDLADKVNVDAENQQQYHRTKKQGAEQGAINSSDIETEEDDLYKRTVTVSDAVRNWRELVPDALAIIPMIASSGGDDIGVVALRTLLMGGPDVPKAFRDLGRPLQGMFQPGVKFIENDEARNILPSGPPLYDPETLTDRTERLVRVFFDSSNILFQGEV